MDLSVILPTRNRSALLLMALKSALRQQDVSLEVIVVDEASTDDTRDVAAGLRDTRVRVIRHDAPQGVATARNSGATHALGAWLAFIDDDDLWAPDKLTRQLQAADAAGRDWAYTGAVNFIGNCQIVQGAPPEPPEVVVAALPRYNAIPGGGSNVIVRRAAWLRAGPFDRRLRNTEDWEMWIRLAKLGLPAWVCNPLVARRLHTSNASLDRAEVVRGAKLIQQLHHTQVDWGRLHRWMAQSAVRDGRLWEAFGQFARAAVRGQARLVAADLGLYLGRGRRAGAMAGPAAASSAWRQAAEPWLREFRREPLDGSDQGGAGPRVQRHIPED